MDDRELGNTGANDQRMNHIREIKESWVKMFMDNYKDPATAGNEDKVRPQFLVARVRKNRGNGCA